MLSFLHVSVLLPLTKCFNGDSCHLNNSNYINPQCHSLSVWASLFGSSSLLPILQKKVKINAAVLLGNTYMYSTVVLFL